MWKKIFKFLGMSSNEESVDLREEECVDLPEDTIVNILEKLPLKSLIRFRLDSKSPFSCIISSQPFIESHLARSDTPPLLLITACETQPRRIGISKFFLIDPEHRSCVPLTNPDSKSFVSQCVNGLVCIGRHDYFQLYNLTIREYLDLPLPPFEFDNPNPSHSFGSSYFLGFDPYTKTYKVLAMSYRVQHEIYEYYVFTLGASTNTSHWRKLECTGIGGNFSLSAPCVNGTIYLRRRQNYIEELLAFDLRNEKFRCITWPSNTYNTPYYTYFFPFKLKESLGLAGYGHGRNGEFMVMKIWKLEDNKTESPLWIEVTKDFVRVQNKYMKCVSAILPTQKDEELLIVFGSGSPTFTLLNLKDNHSKIIHISGLPCGISNLIPYVPSLVSFKDMYRY